MHGKGRLVKHPSWCAATDPCLTHESSWIQFLGLVSALGCIFTPPPPSLGDSFFVPTATPRRLGLVYLFVCLGFFAHFPHCHASKVKVKVFKNSYYIHILLCGLNKSGVKGHLDVINLLVKVLENGYCIHIKWCIFMGLRYNDPWVEWHMQPNRCVGLKVI